MLEFVCGIAVGAAFSKFWIGIWDAAKAKFFPPRQDDTIVK